MSQEEYVLRFSHKIVEHLGIKLYQNKPTNVIAELVSNSWDANAENVWVDLDEAKDGPCVVVMDDGDGMTPDVLRKNYLVIGKPKREKTAPGGEVFGEKRRPMGRKGIGKLAPFGIASEIQLLSVSGKGKSRRVTWLRFDVTALREREDLAGDAESSYKPEVVCSNITKGKLLELAVERGHGVVIKKFVSRIASKAGTATIMTGLLTKRPIDADLLRQAMGRRFTVTLLRPDFKVHINAKPLTEKDALPEFSFTLGSVSAPVKEQIAYGEKKLEVSSWAGFVGTAQWAQDEAGVGVYAHGKIAQDRPFAFGHKGGEVFMRYLYGVVEADWLDEQSEDLISTDRTTVDWDQPAALALRTWGERKVNHWITEYEKFRRTADKTENIDRIRKSKNFKLSPTETEAIAELLSEISPAIGNDEETKQRAVDSLAGAWIHLPMRAMTKKLWDGLKSSESGAAHFLLTIEQLRDHLVPESLSLAVTFAQRIYALSMLYERITNGTETDLQKLIEHFPWILSPEMEKLTANQQLKTAVEELEAKGHATPQIELVPASALKPDFVFFSPPGEYDRIVVVELKNPGQAHHLTGQNELQLITYMKFFQIRYPRAELQGYLIGNNYLKMTSTQINIQVLDWSDVFNRSRKGHVELLASMLVGANPDPNDTRVAQVATYGGKETLELLDRLADRDADLKEVMSQFAPSKTPPKKSSSTKGIPRTKLGLKK